MSSAAFALPKENNIICLKVVDGKLSRKEDVKYNKDGTVSKVTNNKKARVSSEVYGFNTKEEMESMMNVFNNRILCAQDKEKERIAYRDRLLFIIGINIGIRASDLTMLKWSDFLNEDGSFKRFYNLQPKKQKGKFVKIFFNNVVKKDIENYLSLYPVEDFDSYIFCSKKTGKPILPSSVCEMVKRVAEKAGIKKNIGSHSMRKTFGFWHWHEADDKQYMLTLLQKIFGHSNQDVTMKYIGLLDEELEDVYYSVELGAEFI